MCKKLRKKTVNEVNMHKFLVCTCKSQDISHSQKKIVRSHDREAVTFRNSDYGLLTQIQLGHLALKVNQKNLPTITTHK